MTIDSFGTITFRLGQHWLRLWCEALVLLFVGDTLGGMEGRAFGAWSSCRLRNSLGSRSQRQRVTRI